MNTTTATQVVTQDNVPPPDSTSNRAPDQPSGQEPKDTELPKAKRAPSEVPKPPDSAAPGNKKPSKKQKEKWQRQRDDYDYYTLYLDTKQEVEEVWASDEPNKIREHFLAKQDYGNQYEAAEELVDMARVIIETDMDPTIRETAYNNLRTLCQVYPELKPMFDWNVDALIEWAKNEYKGDRPVMLYIDEKGNTTTKEPVAEDNNPWTRRRAQPREDALPEDPPEEYKFTSTETEYLASIRKAWADARESLTVVMFAPEEIRGIDGDTLKSTNEQIGKLAIAHATEINDKNAPDLKIPVTEMILMITKAVEQAIMSGERNLRENKEATSFFARIQTTAERMYHYVGKSSEEPTEWITKIHKAYDHHIDRVAREKLSDLEKLYTNSGFWSKELRGFLLGSMPRESRNVYLDPRIDKDIVMADADDTSAEAPPASQDPNPLKQFVIPGAPVTHTAQTGPAASGTHPAASGTGPGYGQLPTSSDRDSPQKSQDWVESGWIQGKDGEYRRVGGLRKCGTSHQMLVRMNAEEEKIAFWHMVGSLAAPADRKRWIENDGLVIEAFDKTLTKGVKTYSPIDFKVTGIAVVPRLTGETYVKRSITLIQGSFSHDRFSGKQIPQEHKTFEESRFYIISALRTAWGDKITEAWFTNLMNNNRFERPVDPEGRKTAEHRKKIMRTRRALLKELKKEKLEGSEDIEQESDGSLDHNDGAYVDEGDGWVVPDRKHETPNGAAQSGTVEQDKILATVAKMIDERVDKRLDDFTNTFKNNWMPDLIKQFKDSMGTLLDQRATVT